MWNLGCLYYVGLGRLRYVGLSAPPIRRISVASGTWDLCLTYVASAQRGTFIASVSRLRYSGPMLQLLQLHRTCGRFRYVEPVPFVMSPPLHATLVASAMGYFGRLRYVHLFRTGLP